MNIIKKKTCFAPIIRKGFTLAEVLAAMIIGAMVMVSILGIYSRAERSAAAVREKLDSSRLSSEVLQRIAEDLNRVISTSTDTKVTIENKFKNGFPAARLTMTKTIKDVKNTEQKFEEIVWQSLYDYESPDDGLVLYRSYSGMAMEDKVLDTNKDDLELERLVPICSGITFFKITALKGELPVEKWDDAPPPGIKVTISFAETFKRVNGTLDVLDEEKISRTIAIDRTRKISFAIETTESPMDADSPRQADTIDADTMRRGMPEKTEKD